jgi:hypothetical protein
VQPIAMARSFREDELVTLHLGPSDSLRPTAPIAARPISDGVILVNLESGQCWELNSVGALIWDRLSQGDSLDSISRVVAHTYSIDIEMARGDTEALLSNLVEQGIVEVPSASGTL